MVGDEDNKSDIKKGKVKRDWKRRKSVQRAEYNETITSAPGISSGVTKTGS